jgi:murein DD-endopeptidase MepM/ murein hydrolase activator NlpD
MRLLLIALVIMAFIAEGPTRLAADARVVPQRGGATSSQSRESGPAIKIDATPGTVVRWSVPIDLLQKPGSVRVSRHGAGPAAFATINVLPAESAREDIMLGDIPQADPSPVQLRQNAREQAQVARLWTRREGPAQFTLPLAAPTKVFPAGKGFGSTWVFDKPPGTSELHSGADYALAAGTPVAAVADGAVVLAGDLFFAGNAVFIDHGNGLISMYFHLRDVTVKSGQNVKQGESIGVVGSTGRTTGPHLHLGVRWHNARIDPAVLFGDPAKIPTVGQ